MAAEAKRKRGEASQGRTGARWAMDGRLKEDWEAEGMERQGLEKEEAERGCGGGAKVGAAEE